MALQRTAPGRSAVSELESLGDLHAHSEPTSNTMKYLTIVFSIAAVSLASCKKASDPAAAAEATRVSQQPQPEPSTVKEISAQVEPVTPQKPTPTTEASARVKEQWPRVLPKDMQLWLTGHYMRLHRRSGDSYYTKRKNSFDSKNPFIITEFKGVDTTADKLPLETADTLNGVTERYFVLKQFKAERTLDRKDSGSATWSDWEGSVEGFMPVTIERRNGKIRIDEDSDDFIALTTDELNSLPK